MKGDRFAALTDEQLVATSDLFDADYYTARHNPDRHKTFHPVRHFLKFGTRQGLSPSHRFIAAAYLVMNPDVAHSGVNPLVHYLRHGSAEGRTAYAREDIGQLGLDRTTPREQMWLSILASSGLFDADHYCGEHPEAVESGLHPMLHFLRNAKGKAIDPGPSFDAAAHMSQFPAIAEKGHVAVIHALNRNAARAPGQAARTAAQPQTRKGARARIGAAYRLLGPLYAATRKRDFRTARALSRQAAALLGRGATEADYDAPLPEAAAAALVSSSRLFDADWYSAHYPDVARSGIDPALHYVRIGAPENRRPSMNFDPEHYAAYGLPPHVRNPLVHYLRIGRAEGMRPTALLDFLPAVRKPLLASGAEATIFAAPRPHAIDREIAWTRHAEIAGDGLPEALLLPGEADAGALSAYRRLAGLPPAPDLDGTPDDIARRRPAGGFSTCLGPLLSVGPRRLADAWHAGDATLRLRFGTSDAADAPLVLRAFQARPASSAPRLCAEALLAQPGPGYLDVALEHPLTPMLLVLAAVGGEALEFGLIPFPSLLRGGLHHAEVVAASSSPDAFEDLQRYADDRVREMLQDDPPATARVVVRRAGATGAESVFQQPVAEWLTSCFGVKLELDEVAANGLPEAFLRGALAMGPEAPPRPGATLTIAHDAVPTIAALSARALPAPLHSVCGSFLVTETPAGRPRWSVDMPPMSAELMDLQPPAAGFAFPTIEGGATEPGVRSPLVSPPLAIHHRRLGKRQEPILLVPLAPDAEAWPTLLEPAEGAVAVILFVKRPADATRALLALAAQTVAARLVVTACIEPAAGSTLQEIKEAATRLFPGRASVRIALRPAGAEIALIASESDALFLLATHDEVLAHDPRTLETLLALARNPDVASVGCVALREVVAKKSATFRFQSGGYFPERHGEQGELVLALPDTLDAFPNAVYPVAGNAFDFTLLRREAATACLGTEPDDSGGADIAFALATAAEGWRHLCASSVRVSVAPDAPEAVAARIASRPDGGWSALLSAAARLTELR